MQGGDGHAVQTWGELRDRRSGSVIKTKTNEYLRINLLKQPQQPRATLARSMDNTELEMNSIHVTLPKGR